MRTTFIRTLTEMAAENSEIEVLTGDLGYGIWNDFAARYPDRFTNVGIAEQNMISIAAGMAQMGKTVFAYSIGNFPTFRCLEQIRNDCAYHCADVKIVSAGAGLSYGALGMSHHATEDLAVMRVIPGIKIYTPSDQAETAAVVKEMAGNHLPCYLRIGRDAVLLHREPVRNPLKGGLFISGCRDGWTDAVFLVAGDIISEVIRASDLLNGRKIRTSVYSVPVLKPFDEKVVKQFYGKTKMIVTVEEHSVIGGLGSAVAEILAEQPFETLRLVRIGLKDLFPDVVGDREWLRREYGLCAESIAGRVEASLT